MRKWAMFVGMSAIVLTISGTISAQSNSELIRKVEALEKKLEEVNQRTNGLENQNRVLAAENESLRTKVDTIETTGTSDLEKAINGLADSGSWDGGATVKSGANPITITGEARVRAGWTTDRDFGTDLGSMNDEDDDGTFVDQRFNLGFDFVIDKQVSTHFEVISNALWDNGGPSHESGDIDEVDLYQGWILISGMFGRDELGARVGRQEIVLGNEYQFGNNDFFGGETFDALLTWWNDDNFRAIFVWTKLAANGVYNPSGHPYNPAGAGGGYDDDEAYVLYTTIKAIKDHEIDIYYAYLNGHSGTTLGTLGNVLGVGFEVFAHLVGARIGGEFKDVLAGLDYNVEVAYEFGDLQGVNIDVDGFSSEGTVGLTFSSESLARLYFMYIFAEGLDGNDSGYVPLFPETHAQIDWSNKQKRIARWGIMDIMPMANVIAFQLGFTFRPNPDWILGISGQYGWHEADVTTVAGTQDDGIGGEIDLFAEHRMNEKTTLGFGFGVFFPDEGAPLQGGGFVGPDDDDPTLLLYMQLRVTF